MEDISTHTSNVISHTSNVITCGLPHQMFTYTSYGDSIIKFR